MDLSKLPDQPARIEADVDALSPLFKLSDRGSLFARNQHSLCRELTVHSPTIINPVPE